MEWWIPVIILGIIFGIAGLIALIVFAVSSSKSKGDYKDGGGKQYGAPTGTTLFMSQDEIASVQGERFANYHLRPLLRNDEYLLTNLLIPLKNGRTTEIDSVIISRKGIFCIETKNWAGQIYGKDGMEYWTQTYDDPNRTPRQHKNPVIQNERHCGVLDHIFHGHFTVEGAVIFVNPNTEYYVKSNSCYIINQFKAYYRCLPDSQLTIEEVKQVFQKLLKFIPSEEELEAHKESLRSNN